MAKLESAVGPAERICDRYVCLWLEHTNGDDGMQLEAIRGHAALPVEEVEEADSVQLDEPVPRRRAQRTPRSGILDFVAAA